MATELWAIGLVVIASLAGALGPIMFKKAAQRLKRSPLALLKNYYLFAGAGFYALGTILFIPALKGGELSVLYPFVSLTYVWVSLLSVFLLKERMNMVKWSGVACIIIGVTLIGIGSVA
ncbi:EamA family transporter [Candidatus Woesearchaeota archaeon]|nr:EamA family transporter [Candidatus Woesearchaeota archaeon]